MSGDNGPSGRKSEGGAAKSSGFGNAFSSGKDRAGDAERSAEEIGKGTPGAGDGYWDEEEECVSGDVSAFVRGLESGRDPWHPRQTAHGALDVMKGFLGPHFKNFQTVADGQRKVSEDPGATSGMATSAAQSTAGDEAFRKSAKISDEDQPSISEDVQRGLKGTSYQIEGAVLVAGGMGSSPDVAVDPSLDKAYVVTEGGKLYAVDLATHTKRQVMTIGDPDGSLGTPGGVALDGNGNAYVTDRSGGRVLRVRLSTGYTEKIARVTQACGIRLERPARRPMSLRGTGNCSRSTCSRRRRNPGSSSSAWGRPPRR